MSEETLNQITRTVGHPDFTCTFGQMVAKKEQFWHGFYDDMRDENTAQRVCGDLHSYIKEGGIQSFDPTTKLMSEHFKSFIAIFPGQHFENGFQAMINIITLLVNMHKHDIRSGYTWNADVSNNPKSKQFSFSIGGEAFFIPFMHPHAYAPARRSPDIYAVFNSHKLFQALRLNGKYEASRKVIRQRQMDRFGFVPSLLDDFGLGLEFPQYALPNEKDIDVFWEILHQVGGEHPFGMPNSI